MPRSVDHCQRRRDILAAANQVIAEVGLRGLSFRAVADVLGGSTTFVTHCYGSQRDLREAFATSLVESWEREIADVEESTSDPYDGLRRLLEWLIPLTPMACIEERSRISLLAQRNLGDDVRVTFIAWEARIADLLQQHLRGLLEREMLNSRLDSLRVVTKGITLAAIECPERWPPDRQLEVLHRALADMGLLSPAPDSSTQL